MARPNRIARLTHGCSSEPWYEAWKTMKRRCENTNDPNYKYYGGKGISVCDEWHDPKKFGEWAINNGYAKGLTIDRIDVNGNYEPDNCRWATPKEQANNRSSCIYYEFDGEYRTLAEWAEICGINRFTLWSRINKQGWTIEKALTEPVESLRQKGRWVDIPDMDEFWGELVFHKCSLCDELQYIKTNYCPNCGADMRED